jgi:hypothetical protein
MLLRKVRRSQFNFAPNDELNLVLLGQEIKKNMVGLKCSANETNNECVQNSEVETSWGDNNSGD